MGNAMTQSSCSKLYGRRWGPAVVAVLRLVVGGVFLFSGFTKGIDPWGSIYKFGEYASMFGLAGYDGLLPFMAFSVSAIEFALGVFLLVGIYRRFTPYAMLLMMAVMLPLTLYIAVTGEMSDCGCFGDAVTLTNWGTFWKNVPLTLAVVYLVAYNNRVKNIYGFAVQWIVALLTFVYLLVIAWEGYFTQPLLDFRPFPVGTAIAGDDGGTDEDFLFLYEKDGVQQGFVLDSLPDDTWTFVDRVPVDGGGDDEKVADASVYRHITVFDEDYKVADGVVKGKGEQLLLLFPSLSDVVIPFTYHINETYDFCMAHGIDVVGLTSNGRSEIAEWNDLSMAAYPMYIMDDSELKMVARGNPAAVLLSDGKIVWKRTLQSIPIDRLSRADDFAEVLGWSPHHYLYFVTTLYLAAMLLVLIINRTHIVVKFSLNRVRKSRKKQVNLQSDMDGTYEPEEKQT